jgi:hypothetical protein
VRREGHADSRAPAGFRPRARSRARGRLRWRHRGAAKRGFEPANGPTLGELALKPPRIGLPNPVLGSGLSEAALGPSLDLFYGYGEVGITRRRGPLVLTASAPEPFEGRLLRDSREVVSFVGRPLPGIGLVLDGHRDRL